MATKATVDKDSGPSLEAFSLALKLITSACGATPTFVLSPSKGGCLVSVHASGSEASVRVPFPVDGLEEPLEVPYDGFTSAISRRKAGKVEVKGSNLHVTAGAYKAQLNTNAVSSAPEVSGIEGDDVQEFMLTPELHQWLSSKLPQIKIEKVHSALPDVMLNVRLSKKQWYMSTYDAQQMCFLSNKPLADAGEFSVLLPYSRFAAFVKDLPITNCKVQVTMDALLVSSKQFKLKLALPHVEEGSFAEPDVAYSRAKELAKIAGEPFVVSASVLSDFLENSKSLLSVGAEVQFSPAGKKGTTLKVTSPAGETKLAIPGVSVEQAFGLDHRFVQTLLSKQAKPKRGDDDEPQDDTVTFELCDNTFVICKAQATYVALLTASETESE